MLLSSVLCLLGVTGKKDRICYQQTDNSTSQHLPTRQSYFISSGNEVTRLGGLVECRTHVEDLDFTRALNQMARDILVDKMEKCAVYLLE